jgi:hypothetical protein
MQLPMASFLSLLRVMKLSVRNDWAMRLQI